MLFVIAILVKISSAYCQTNSENLPVLTGLYLGLKPPSATPEVFLPGVVSTQEFFEFSNTISPDGKEFYFVRRINNKDIPMVVRWENGTLLQPEEAKFLKNVDGFEPHFSPDGSKLYITRFAPPPSGINEDKNLSPQDMEAQMVNIWAMDKQNTGWGEPKFCVNGMYVTTSNSGAIYTTDIRSRSLRICRFQFVDGKYSQRESLNGGVNSPSPGAHPCITPDESYIVFDSKRGSDPENADLFVCFKQKDGNWSEAYRLDALNTNWNDLCPAISPDGRYLFYMSKGDIYWVSTEVIWNAKSKQQK